MKNYLNKPVLLSGKPTGGRFFKDVPVMLTIKNEHSMLIHSNDEWLVGGHRDFKREGYKYRWAIGPDEIGRNFTLRDETVDEFNLRCFK